MNSRFTISLLLVLLLLGGCEVPASGPLTRGSGNIESESREVSGFSAVELRGSGTLIIEQGTADTLTIETDDNLLPLLTSEVVGDRLVLGIRPNSGLQPTRGITFRLTAANLEGVTLSGSGEISFDTVDADTFTVEISGSGNVRAAGQAERQVVTLSGSGNYDGRDLVTRAAEVDVSGSGSATVNASESLDVSISGSGDVTYSGDPVVTEDISGSGDIQRR